MQNSNNDILNAIVQGGDVSTLPPPQSRNEAFLIRILGKLDDMSGGGGASIPIYICGEGEYDAVTGEPTIASPKENVFYLVPNGTLGDDMFAEWIYKNDRWEQFGTGGAGTTYTFSEGDVNGAFSVTDSAGSTQAVNIHGLRDFCYVDSDEDVELIFDSGTIDSD